MKRIFTILAIAAFGVTALPTFANNWQWQLDQIKADQQRRTKCLAAELAKQFSDKRAEVPKKTEQPAPSSPAK